MCFIVYFSNFGESFFLRHVDPKNGLNLLAFDFVRKSTDMCTETRRTRAWSDPQMYTHLAFVPGVCVALQREPVMLELVVLQGVVCVMSLWYHRNREHECGMAKVEHAFAHAPLCTGGSRCCGARACGSSWRTWRARA